MKFKILFSISLLIGLSIFLSIGILIGLNMNVAKPKEWFQAQLGLWQSQKTGDLGIKTLAHFGGDNYEDRFLIYMGVSNDTDPKIKNVIDKKTFRQVGSQLYKDAEHVYYHRVHSDGGVIYEVEADAKSFEAIGLCFAKDKNNIYYVSGSSGMGTFDVDYDSFRSCFGCGCASVDKNGVYYFDDKMDFEQSKGEMRETYEYLRSLD